MAIRFTGKDASIITASNMMKVPPAGPAAPTQTMALTFFILILHAHKYPSSTMGAPNLNRAIAMYFVYINKHTALTHTTLAQMWVTATSYLISIEITQTSPPYPLM